MESVSYLGKPTSYFANARPEMLAFLPQKVARLLDVGCGRGQFGAMLKSNRKDIEVWGVEPSFEAFQTANQVLDRVFHGSFDENLGLPDGYFDVVIFNDSLEHFPDPFPPLSLARRLLAPSGSLILSVPNVRSWSTMKNYLIHGDWKYEEEGVLDKTHLRFFTQRSITRTLAETGYSIKSIQGLNHCWPDFRLKLIELLAPRCMQDIPYLQLAVVAFIQEGIADSASLSIGHLQPKSQASTSLSEANR